MGVLLVAALIVGYEGVRLQEDGLLPPFSQKSKGKREECLVKRRFTYGVYPQGTLEVTDGAHGAATQNLINIFRYGVPLPDDKKKKRRRMSIRGVMCKCCIMECGESKQRGESSAEPVI